MAALMPEIADKMARGITSEDWNAIEAGKIGLAFDVVLRGNTVKVECMLQRNDEREQLFVVSRTLAPAAQA